MQDRSFELSQLASGLHACLIDEQRPPLAIALERVGLTSCAVEGEHELRARALTERRLLDSMLQLRDQLRVAAECERTVDETPVAPCLEDVTAPGLALDGAARRISGAVMEARGADPERLRATIEPDGSSVRTGAG